MKKKDEIKVCLVGSSGGHLTHLYMLKPFWKDKNRFWVTFDKEDARSLLEGEKVYPCYFPTNRSIKALIKNTKIAWDVLHKEKPDLIISCGAAVAVPFFYIGKMMGAKLVYIEVFDRIDKPTMTGKMVYEYAYRLKKKVNIVQLTFNCSFAKSLVSMYAFPAKVLKKLSVNSFIPYYDFISNCVTNVFEKTYDVAIDFYGYGSFVTAFLATKIQAKKKATWIHDEKPYWMKSVQKYLCEYDKIYGVSQAVVDAFCREYPHYKDKAAVFYNVIDIEEIKRKSEQDEVIPFKDSFNIVTVGRLTEQKGYDIAIKAASILKKRKINFVWYAIGGGRDEEKLKKLVEKCCLENQFVFLGRKRNPYPYMKHCDLYVQPSRHEGYVITLVEARALCLPILSSDIPSAREQIQDGINGYVAELSAEAIADKIEYLYNNPSQMEKTVKYLKEHPIDFSKELLKLETI